MRDISIVALILGVAAVLAGVYVEGTTENPMNLFLPYLLGTGILEIARKRPEPWFRLIAVPAILGAMAGGVGWTLGAAHVGSTYGLLVWIGTAVAIAASVELSAARIVRQASTTAPATTRTDRGR